MNKGEKKTLKIIRNQDTDKNVPLILMCFALSHPLVRISMLVVYLFIMPVFGMYVISVCKNE